MDEGQRGISRPSTEAGLYQRGINYFLGISIDAYKPPFKALRNCVNDVTAVHKVLKEEYDFEEENMRLLCNEAASRRDILRTLHETLKKIGENDSLVFMYSGHGENLDGTNVGFMIPQDAAFEEDYINLSDIKSRLDASKAKHIFVIFDACFSGLILTQRDVRKFNVPENIPSRFALTSGRNSPVSDGKGNNSPFATALIDELSQNKDSLGAGLLSQKILDKFRETGRDDEQLPNFGRINEDIKYQGQYYFYPKNYELSLARERTKRLEAEDARKVAENALMTAERERKRAEKLVRAATNTAAFMQVREFDCTKALRMMQYNGSRHPESQISHDLFNRTLANHVPLYDKILRGCAGDVSAVLFSPPSTRGKKVLMVMSDPSVKLWDVATGQVEKTFEGHYDAATSIAFSPDGKKILTGSLDCTAKLWDIETTMEVWTFDMYDEARDLKNAVYSPDGAKESTVKSVAFSPDGRTIALGFATSEILILDAAEGKEEKTLKGHTKGITAITFSPDGKKLATSSDDNTARLWDMATGKTVKTYEGHTAEVIGVAFSPKTVQNTEEGKWLLTGSSDKTAILWDTEMAKAERVFTGNMTAISAVAFSPDGQYIITGSHDKRAKLWEVATGQVQNVFLGHSDLILCLDFSPDGTKIVTGSSDSTAKIWDLHPLKAEKTLKGHTGSVNKALFSPANTQVQKILTTGTNGDYDSDSKSEVILWDAATGQIEKTLIESDTQVHYFSFESNGEQLEQVLLVYFDGKVKLWNLKTGKAKKLMDLDETSITAVDFSKDKQKILAINGEGQAKIWDRASQKVEYILGEVTYSSAIALFSPDDKKILTILGEPTIKLWDAATGQIEKTFEINTNVIFCAAFSPDGQKIVTGGNDKTVRLWDIETGQCEKTLVGHSETVSCLAFSPDGKYLLTGSWDKTARIWDLSSGKALKTFPTEGGAIYCAAFSPDGQKILLGSDNQMVELFDINTGSIEDNIATFPLFELAEEGLTIEASDTPQYMDEFVNFVEKMGISISEAIEMAERHLKDAAALEEFKKRLGE